MPTVRPLRLAWFFNRLGVNLSGDGRHFLILLIKTQASATPFHTPGTNAAASPRACRITRDAGIFDDHRLLIGPARVIQAGRDYQDSFNHSNSKQGVRG